MYSHVVGLTAKVKLVNINLFTVDQKILRTVSTILWIRKITPNSEYTLVNDFIKKMRNNFGIYLKKISFTNVYLRLFETWFGIT